MRQWLARQMMRPWVYRIGCLTIFVAVMFVLRLALVALRDTNDTPFILAVGLPILAALLAYGFWHDRRGY